MKRRGFWTAFALGAAVVLAGLVWITTHVLGLERAECAARAVAEQSDRARLALWRMDSWLNTQLAPEAARPAFDYEAYYSQNRAYTRSLGQIGPGEVLTPSPLLAFESELFPVHFQLAPGDVLSSPQVPTGNLRDLTEATRPRERIEQSATRLAELGGYLRHDDLGARLGRAAALPMNCAPTPAGDQIAQARQVEEVAQRDVQNRFAQSVWAKNMETQKASWTAIGASEAAPGPLLPIWVDRVEPGDGDAARLVFARRVDLPTGTVYQGFAANWPRLQAALIAQVADLYTPGDVRLLRQDAPDDAFGRLTLATVPARLEVPAAEAPLASWSPTRTVLAAAWLALLVAITAVGFTLGSALSLGDRRARFASAVTHELRSPLTTFRMYSEMLAEGMVTDPERRAEYLATLCRESDRLARLVENVLAYARIEEGRHRTKRERIPLGDLLRRIEPTVTRRVAETGFTLRTDVRDADAVVEVDPAIVEQVLYGLCDNACKYAAENEPRVVEITSGVADGRAEIRVRDHGPGIPAEHRREVFRPFERGARPAGESLVPGVGLGLAVARSLARALGGELDLDPGVTDGACFVLRLRTS